MGWVDATSIKICTKECICSKPNPSSDQLRSWSARDPGTAAGGLSSDAPELMDVAAVIVEDPLLVERERRSSPSSSSALEPPLWSLCSVPSRAASNTSAPVGGV